jgi:hypothetical protein
MSFARRRTAVRNRLLAAVALLALGVIPVRAQGGPELILPLVTAIAVASAANHAVPRQVGTLGRGGRPMLSLLPERLQIPDGYEVDLEDFLPARRTSPLNGDRIVSYDLTQRARRGWIFSVAYDQESRGPLGGSGELLTLVAEYRF